ncbi:MAG: OsmC family protein [bacterium]|jgi:osmotically inducible protein OsmC|nr:OsmC family protein [bacterium]
MIRRASAHWQGDLKTGKGTVSAAGGALDQTPYSFHSRFEDGPGTNPEELIAAAHAGCFSMALSGQLASAGLSADHIRTSAELTLERLEAGFTITRVHLVVRATVPGASAEAFHTAAANARNGCPVSRLLKAEITMDAVLE